jgi:hypothetical protein
MGEVKDTVHGTPPKKRQKALKSGDNLVDQFKNLKDTVSDLIMIKDDDTLKEGEAEKAENVRKAAHLRAVHSLLTAAETLLEDY